MGVRHSSQNQRHRSPSEGSSHYSVGSLDNGGNNLLSGPSGSLDLSAERPVSRRRRRRDRNDQFVEAHSLPAHLFPFVTAEIKCPVCNKRIGTNEIEDHLLQCLAKPRVSYNEDVLKSDAGECIICFEDMVTDEHIARLPCLCIYHKKCLDEWFNRNRCCPAHPDQIPQEYTDTSYPSTSAEVEGSSTQNETENTSLDEGSSSQNEAENTFDNSPPESSRESENSANEPNTELTDDNNIRSNGGLQIDLEEDGTLNESRDNVASGGIDSLDRRTDSSPGYMSESPLMHGEEPPDAITQADEDYNPSLNSQSRQRLIGKTIVHVDDGSIHGSPSLFDEDEIAQLTSKIKTILVQESPRSRDFEGT